MCPHNPFRLGRLATAGGLVAAFGLPWLAACGEHDAPTAPADTGPAFSHTPGHRIVNSTADPGNGICDPAQCTLREAIADPGSTEIGFAPGLAGPITLARSLVIEKSLAITGPASGLVIQRRSTDPAFRILRIGSGATVSLTNLTIRNGRTALPGGGIISFGTLSLTGCTVAGNASAQHGGGIDSHGPLTLSDTKVVNNTAATLGGGIHGHDTPLTITGGSVTRNSALRGGGVMRRGGPLRVTNSGISYNTGGGLVQDWGTAALDRVRILGNSTTDRGGGILVTNTAMTLANSTVAGNSAAEGGGILTGDGAQLSVVGSTVNANSGGGIRNQSFGDDAALVLTNSTVSGNSGDGISIRQTTEDDFPSTTLVHATVAFNSGPGISRASEGGAVLRLTNTVVARNGPSGGGPDIVTSGVGGPTIEASHSLVGNGSGSGIANVDGNQVGNVAPYASPIDPRLGALANNGGPTRTHALESGSPAIDAASAAGCTATDQRGVSRPQGEACDIGSYER